MTTAGWVGEDPLVFELGAGRGEASHRSAAATGRSDADGRSRPSIAAGTGDAGVASELARLLPAGSLRAVAAPLPAVPEPVLARHIGRLARRNHHLHHAIYPLGSCTMKHNPAVNEQLAALEGFANLHPLQPEEDAQGALQLMWELERLLAEITGMDRMSLQPAAGAHGEWTGLRMIQAFHGDRGDTARDRVLVPDSAHGTNPASASMCGLEVVTVRSRHDGRVDLADLAAKLDPRVAAIMLTNPNTLGVFETEIERIATLAHQQGALLYYDGANLNALVGIARPGDMGFDVVHLNLHKTFSTPHGGGGPGSGPVGVGRELSRFLPAPTVERDGDRFWLDGDRPHSIGKVRSFYGNFGMLVRAHAYIRRYGSSLNQVARDAVLNARYLQSTLRSCFAMAVEADCLHEFVASTRGGPVDGLRAMDVAKRLIDHGVHPPTVYFPTTVPEALMFEPTETESKRDLDALAAACRAIVDEARHDLPTVRSAPHDAPVARVDEVSAARQPVLRWRPHTAAAASQEGVARPAAPDD